MFLCLWNLIWLYLKYQRKYEFSFLRLFKINFSLIIVNIDMCSWVSKNVLVTYICNLILIIALFSDVYFLNQHIIWKIYFSLNLKEYI